MEKEEQKKGEFRYMAGWLSAGCPSAPTPDFLNLSEKSFVLSCVPSSASMLGFCESCLEIGCVNQKSYSLGQRGHLDGVGVADGALETICLRCCFCRINFT